MRVGVLEHDTVCGQAVDRRRERPGAAIHLQAVGAQCVDGNEKDRTRVRRRQSGRSTGPPCPPQPRANTRGEDDRGDEDAPDTHVRVPLFRLSAYIRSSAMRTYSITSVVSTGTSTQPMLNPTPGGSVVT